MSVLSKNDLMALESILNREKELIIKYETYLQQIKEPQMRSDIQALMAQHRNQYNSMLGVLEDSK